MTKSLNPPLTTPPPHPDGPVAVAIQGQGSATPTIVASGRGATAEAILALAFAHNVKVREDAELASILATLDLDTPIPAEAILAVGEILAKVYEANQQLAPQERPYD